MKMNGEYEYLRPNYGFIGVYEQIIKENPLK